MAVSHFNSNRSGKGGFTGGYKKEDIIYRIKNHCLKNNKKTLLFMLENIKKKKKKSIVCGFISYIVLHSITFNIIKHRIILFMF